MNNRKFILVYPFETGDKAFSGGVPKVVVSNIIAALDIGLQVHLVLPLNNRGLVDFVHNNYPECKIHLVKFKQLSLYSDTKGILRLKNITKNFIHFLIGYRKLKQKIRKIKPEIIHFHEVVNFPILSVYKKAIVILHIHSHRFTNYNKLLKVIFFFINRHCNLILSPTNSIIDGIKKYNRVKYEIIDTPYLDLQNDINIDGRREGDFTGGEKKIIFSFVGRICKIKRIDHFVLALSKLSTAELSKLEFWIIGGTNTKGDERYKSEIIKLIKDNKLERFVRFQGYVDPIESILDVVDYGIILSESEAVPMIGIEFMRFNIPIIGYDAPGINDFLVNEQNGFLIKNGDYNEIYSKIKNITNDEYGELNFSNRIPKIFNRHSIDEFKERLSKIYNDKYT